MKKSQYDWVGWSLENNPYDKDFDAEARERMIQGSQLLLPLIKKYDLGNKLLEVGPFFIPLLTPASFPNNHITFMDNDPYVIKYLIDNYPQTTVISQDCNTLPEKFKQQYTTIVVSHVFNYINYQEFLNHIPSMLSDNGYFFLNNSPHYGLPNFFHPSRPENNDQTLKSIQAVGLKIIEYQLIPSLNKQYQPEERLLVVAKK